MNRDQTVLYRSNIYVTASLGYMVLDDPWPVGDRHRSEKGTIILNVFKTVDRAIATISSHPCCGRNSFWRTLAAVAFREQSWQLSPSSSLLSSSITTSLFHSKLKHIFYKKSFVRQPDWLHGRTERCFCRSVSFIVSHFILLLPERDYVTFRSLLSQIRLSFVTFVRPTQGV